MNQQLLEEIMSDCDKKQVIRYCKKLQKKCSYKSGSDMDNLCSLAYWLYIYDEKDFALKVCKQTNDKTFFWDFSVWYYIFSVWGLQIRILKEKNDYEKANELIQRMDHHLYYKDGSFDDTEDLRRADITYKSLMQTELLVDATKSEIRDLKLNALFDLIGIKDTRLYPKLNKRWEEIEEVIANYISELKLTK